MQPAIPFLSAGFVAGALFGAAAVAGLLSLSEPTSVDPIGDAPVIETGSDAPVATSRAMALDGDPAGQAPEVAPVASDGSATGTAESREIRKLEEQVTDLRVRLASVEQRLAGVLSATTTATRDVAAMRPEPPRTASERRGALVAAGVDAALAEDLVLREAQRSLEQLSLRDQAIREGWLGTEQYREELSRINADVRSLREEIGDDIYDRYLYATGEDNRVKVETVIPGSAAEIAGLQAGDLIESYADQRLFDFSELRNKTTEGEYGEQVAVQVRRAGRVVETWVPRGPLGVTLNSARVEPAP
jgi:hypothetical protein